MAPVKRDGLASAYFMLTSDAGDLSASLGEVRRDLHSIAAILVVDNSMSKSTSMD
jgi:hypothetical protein